MDRLVQRRRRRIARFAAGLERQNRHQDPQTTERSPEPRALCPKGPRTAGFAASAGLASGRNLEPLRALRLYIPSSQCTSATAQRVSTQRAPRSNSHRSAHALRQYPACNGSWRIWSANGGVDNSVTGACIICTNTRAGGDGWFGTVGAGYDWQSAAWVFGIFGDGTFGSLKGNIGDATAPPSSAP